MTSQTRLSGAVPHEQRQQSPGLQPALLRFGFKIQEDGADKAALGCGCSTLRGSGYPPAWAAWTLSRMQGSQT